MATIESIKSQITKNTPWENIEFTQLKTSGELSDFLTFAIDKKNEDESRVERDNLQGDDCYNAKVHVWRNEDRELYAVAYLHRSTDKEAWKGELKYLEK